MGTIARVTLDYVHGYSSRESTRLTDQATTLTELLHGDTRYPDGVRVLEAGCGTGAQTAILAAHSPGATFTSIDVSDESLAAARRAVDAPNVSFQRADIFALPFPDHHFDHVFACFVLEHLADPAAALAALHPPDVHRDGRGCRPAGHRAGPDG